LVVLVGILVGTLIALLDAIDEGGDELAIDGGGAFGSCFFFLNKKSATFCDVIPVSFEMSLKREETDGVGVAVGSKNCLSLPREGWVIILLGGAGFIIGVDAMVGGGGLKDGVISVMIDKGGSFTGIGVGTLTLTGVGTETSSPPITLTGSSENVGNTTGALMLIGVPKLVGVGVMGVKPPDD